MFDIDDYDFTYTKRYTVSSSVVGGAFYNSLEQYMVLVLHDEAYRYDSVPPEFADTIDTVWSVGAVFLPNIKGKYGPSTHLGNLHDLAYAFDERVNKSADGKGFKPGDRVRLVSEVRGNPVGTLGTVTSEYTDSFLPSGYSPADFTGQIVLDSGEEIGEGWFAHRFEKVGAVEPEAAPEPADDDPQYVSLSVAADNSNLRKFVVAFETGEKVADYTLFAEDWNSAANGVVELGEALGLDFNVKGVSVLD